MSRRVPRLLFGPSGICYSCGRRCVSLDQVGEACFHCVTAGAENPGVFMHRRFWQYVACTKCSGSGCDVCNQVGCLVLPREDFDLAALRTEWADVINRHRGRGEILPPSVAALAAAMAP